MADDPAVRSARLALLTALRRTILNIADISEIAPEEPGRPEGRRLGGFEGGQAGYDVRLDDRSV